jgi:Fe-S-cluster-containing hydrogenase component 2
MGKTGVAFTGYPSEKELENAPGVPGIKDLNKGPKAVIECVQHIPCNPCEAACPFGAITIGENITNLPVLDVDKCIGCGNCVAMCPGLAIFIVDMTYSDTEATVEFPYEYLPLPKKGDVVEAVNRAGEVICEGKVVSIRSSKNFANTRVIKMAVPKEFANQARSMKRL